MHHFDFNIGLTGQLVPSLDHTFGKSFSPEQSEKVILRMKVFVGKGPRRRGSSGGHSNEAYVAVPRHFINDVDFLFFYYLKK